MPAEREAQAWAPLAAPGPATRVTHTHLEEAPKVQGAPCKGLAKGHVEGKLSVIIVAA